MKYTIGNTKRWYTIGTNRYYVTMAEALYHKEREEKLSKKEKSIEVYNTSKETRNSATRTTRDSHSTYKNIYALNRRDERLSARQALANDWGVMSRSGNEIVIVKEVKYVPEGTFTAKESEGNRKCRMLVAVSSVSDGTSYQINIADEIHELIGNCSKFRAERLTENKPIQLKLLGNHFRKGDIKAWFRNANLPFKTC